MIRLRVFMNIAPLSKMLLFSSVIQAVGNVSKRNYKTWLIEESWKWFNEHKGMLRVAPRKNLRGTEFFVEVGNMLKWANIRYIPNVPKIKKKMLRWRTCRHVTATVADMGKC